MIPRSTVRDHCWRVGVCMTGSRPPGEKIPQAGGCNGDCALQLGGGGVPKGIGIIESSGVFVIVSRAPKGGLALSR